MYPTREEAERLLLDAKARYDKVSAIRGRWDDHSRTAARCAEAIAARCPGLDAERPKYWAFCMTSAGSTATATSATSITAGSI